ncbi:tRNA pseudouridine(38-40) synthase TruA [Aminipila luticellarii]|uniref:tRNA pseudouridine synthase A n=1 Tax=Aminipila luticellarii TaxID=2507160 RepID=A0A410PY68_9FIRM|nr:tRNA pseudouridine(38-40) synthase TruA [Aminipila luticellarii]QAT43893.1 tRNA pseudouridine(38-40) synthase TruA [Aminipila luticellarii]
MKNILLTIEYDGTLFSGWQRQPEKRTVQGELERVLGIVCRCPVQLNGTSRTDAGVHALGQRASFKGDFGIPTDRLMLAANNILAGGMNAVGKAGDLRILSAEEVPEDFHARFDAKGKKYVYKILNCQETQIFRRNQYYQVRKELNADAMRRAAGYITGTHDFKCFQSAGGQEKKTTVRTVYELNIIEGKTEAGQRTLSIEIKGDGFLYNMVRIITGTLVEVGLGKLSPEALPDILKSGQRQKAGHTAPPQGLYLSKVYYDLEDLAGL